jgi:peptide/nickel transport system substrate-binding protein
MRSAKGVTSVDDVHGQDMQTSGVSRRDVIKGAGATALGLGIAGGLGAATAGAAAPSAPKKGGSLRIGITGSAADIMDPQYIVAKADQARTLSTWETLLTFDENFATTSDYGLATEVSNKGASQYTVRLRKGVEFHNGKEMTADDVVYSYRRLLNPSIVSVGKPLRTFVDPSGVTKVDKYTVRFDLKAPNVEFRSALAVYTHGIVPDGFVLRTDADRIGTGAYKLVSFTPGRESVHKRYANHWEADKAYLDEVRIITFSDKTALVNALLAKQIDAAVDIPLAQFATLKKNKNLSVIESSAGAWDAMCMRLDIPPMNDPNVRAAMRLLVNRKQMIQQVLSGRGQVANDLYGRIDEFYNANNFPQREQDIPAALKLLAKSGYSKAKPLVVDLWAPNDTGGLPEMVNAMAAMADKTGGVVKINAKVVDGTYWDTNGQYMNTAFFTTYWSPRAYLAQAIASMDTYPETKWPPSNSTFRADHKTASGTVNPAKRKAIVARMQKEEWEKGTYIIPYFKVFADAFTKKLNGVEQRPSQLNLDYYGHGFKNFWLA